MPWVILVPLTRERREQVRNVANRVLGLTLALLFDRYAIEPDLCYRWADGSSSGVSVSSLIDGMRLGTLFEAFDEVRPDASAVEAIVTQVGGSGTATLTFTATLITEGIEVTLSDNGTWSDDGLDVGSILNHAKLLLATADRETALRFEDLDIVSGDERNLLLNAFNGAEANYTAATLHGLFIAQAMRTPNAVAVIDGEKSLTYAELDRASNCVAHCIRPFLMAPGDAVAVSGLRSIALLVAKIGVMKAGGAFLYVTPETPASRAALMCEIASVRCALGVNGAPPWLGSHTLVSLDECLRNTPNEAPLDDIASEATTAYILFTSGSTGEPKGVVRPHRMNTTRISLERDLYGLGPDDRFLLKSIIAFRETYTPLATGGTVIVARSGGELDDSYLVELIRRQKITVCSFVPSMLRVLLANPRFGATPLPIRHLFVAGETLDADLEQRLRALGLAVRVTYTLTEADYVSHRGEPPRLPSALADIGRPIDMSLYVCDAKGRLLPPGFVGEFLTGGPGLAAGYLNRPKLTAERFIPNSIDPGRAPILFRTGDLGRYRCDGQVEYVGRADSQIKIRGQRVEPVEVEAAIRNCAQVENAVVTSIQDKAQGNLLVAYVVTRSGNLDVAGLRAMLLDRFPSFMVPTYLVQVPALIQLPSGKVDRARLRSAFSERPTSLPTPTLPEDDLQKGIAEVWSRVLGIDEVGIDDVFSSLGGDSLRLMLLRQALEVALRREIALPLLLTAGTIRELAEQLRRTK